MIDKGVLNASPIMETTGYSIIAGGDRPYVEKQVQEALATGWMLHGGLQIHVNAGQWYFAQAMTKMTEKDTRGPWG